MASNSGSSLTQENWQNMINTVNQLQQDLSSARAELTRASEEINNLRSRGSASNTSSAQAHKPTPFDGRSRIKIEAWVNRMEAYVAAEPPERAFTIAVSYLEGDAYTWWDSYKKTQPITSWQELRTALLARFSPLNKTLAARDKLSKWRQLKDVATYNSDFLQILLDIPDITEAEKLDRYCRGLKTYIWESLCTKEYQKVESVMTDALKVEAAKKGSRVTNNTNTRPGPARPGSTQASSGGIEPMELGSTSLVKLTPEERERCFREGRCLRCREKGHLAKECPKGKGQKTPRRA